MIKIRNECVRACPERMCASSCPCLNVKHYYCDNCGEECDPEDLYDFDGDMLCAECLLSNFEKIDG